MKLKFNTLRKLGGKDKDKDKDKDRPTVAQNPRAATAAAAAAAASSPTSTLPVYRPADFDFCAGISENDVDVRITANDGFTGKPTVLAYDTLQSVVAIGSESGRITLLGKAGVERMIVQHSKMAVRHLLFVTPEPLLVSIDGNDKIYIWQLETLRIFGSIPRTAYLDATASVTAATLLPGSPYFLVGTSTGAVHVFEARSCKRTNYVIPPPATKLPGVSPAVIFIACHPEDANQVLVGYGTGEMLLYEFKTKRLVRRFALEGERASVPTCAAWHPSGRVFVSGHGSGMLAFWDASVTRTPLEVRAVKESPPGASPSASSRDPVVRVRWCSIPGSSDTVLVVAGGTPSDDMRGITVLQLADGRYAAKKSNLLATERAVIDLVVTGSSPWMNGSHDPTAVLALVDGGGFRAYDLTRGLSTAAVPGSLQLSTAPIVCLKVFANVPRFLADALAAVSGKEAPPAPWPATGGALPQLTPTAPPGCDLVITGHADNVVRFWDARPVALRLLYSLPLSPPEGPALPLGAIATLDFCPNDVLLAVGLTDGQVRLFEFVTQADLQEAKSDAAAGGSSDSGDEGRQGTGDIITVFAPSAPGLCMVVRSVVHKAAITALNLNTSWGLLAVGDAAGVVSVMALASAEVIFSRIMTATVPGSTKPERQPINVLTFSFSYPSDSAQQPHCMLWIGADAGVFSALRIMTLADDAYDFRKVSSVQMSEAVPAVLVAVLDETGRPLLPHKDLWPPAEVDPAAEAAAAASSNGSPGGPQSAAGGNGGPQPAGPQASSSGTFHLQHPPHFVVIVVGSHARVHLNAVNEARVAKATLDDDVTFVAAQVVTQVPGFENRTCLACLTSIGDVHIYALPSLKLLRTEHIVDDEKLWRLRQARFTHDGRLFMFVGESELQRHSLFAAENILNLPAALPSLIAGPVAMPARPGGGFMKTLMGGFLNTAPGELTAVFDSAVDEQAAERERKEREELLGRKEGTAKRAAASSTAASGPKEAQKEATTAGQAAAMAMRSVQERGEKLSELGDKTEELADSARNFYEMARAMRMREQNKKWYEL